MLADALLSHRLAAPTNVAPLRAQPCYSTLLALTVWLTITWDNVPREYFPLIAAAEGLALTLSYYLLRVSEIAVLSQGCLVVAQVTWMVDAFNGAPSPHWWSPLLLLAITIALSHWWQKQKALRLPPEFALIWQALYGLASVGVLYSWLAPKGTAPSWLVVSTLLALGLTAYGVITRAWFLAVCGQIFMLVSVLQFAGQLWDGKPAWGFPLAPIAALALFSGVSVQWFKREPGSEARIRNPLLQIARVYRWVALVMALCWVWQYIPAQEQIWFLASLGLSAFVWSGWRRNSEALLFSAVFTGSALVLFWLPLIGAPVETRMVYWPNLCVIVTLLGQRQLAQRLPGRYGLSQPIHNTIILIGGVSLWRFVSAWVLESASGFYLTASWSLLALGLFTCGIVLRERSYRWLGLGILACALTRVAVFDIWRLQSLYRVLSLMALGIVLLVLGFIYSKYQEKIKEWL
jgi:hypothetical protein